MKTKKLIAILTIVALMMGLVPMAAFAANDYAYGASIVTTNKETVAAGEEIEFTVQMRAADGYAVATPGQEFWVKSSRDVDTFVDSTTATAESGDSIDDGIKVTANPTAAGVVTFKIKSNIAGTSTITLAADSEFKKVIGEAKKITFTASATDVETVSVTGSSTYNPGLDDATHPQFGMYAGRLQVGFNLTLSATVKDNKNNGVAGQSVTFYKAVDGGNPQVVGTATTNALGVATLSGAAQTKAGEYVFTAKAGGKTSTPFNVSMRAGAPAAITAVDATKYSEKDVAVKFTITDAFGNIINDEDFWFAPATDKLTAVIATAPEDSALLNEIVSMTNSNTVDGNNIVANFTADKNGSYMVIGSISNTGITAITTVNVGDFGTAKSLKLTGTTSMKPDATAQLTAKLVDENGFEKAFDSYPGEVVFSSSDVSLVEVNNEGIIKSNALPTTRGVATITATHLETGLVATLNVAVTGAPVDVIVTPTVTDKVAKISMQLADAQGNKANYDAETTFTVIAPAEVSITEVKPFAAATGVGSFTATSTDAGQKSVTVVANTGLTKTFTISFATPASDIPGATNINMYIGAKGFFADGEAVSCDVAPFIGEGNRTFVELRNLANAMGVDNDDITYVDGVITLSRADMTLVLTIGSNVITKTVDGVTTTITADVAPYIIAEAGRTVLPLRAVGEAFGYTVNYDDVTRLISISK